VGSGRGRSRRSKTQTRAKVCQGNARDREKDSSVERKGRGGRVLPASSSGSGSTCGPASLNAGGLAAVLLGFWEGDACGR
jgi:hypothetical protein